MFASGKGEGGGGGGREPPETAAAGGEHKGVQRGAEARAPSVHAPESCGSGAG